MIFPLDFYSMRLQKNYPFHKYVWINLELFVIFLLSCLLRWQQVNIEDLADEKVPLSNGLNFFHYSVRCSDGGNRKRQEDDKMIRTESSDNHYFIRCYVVHMEICTL